MKTACGKSQVSGWTCLFRTGHTLVYRINIETSKRILLSVWGTHDKNGNNKLVADKATTTRGKYISLKARRYKLSIYLCMNLKLTDWLIEMKLELRWVSITKNDAWERELYGRHKKEEIYIYIYKFMNLKGGKALWWCRKKKEDERCGDGTLCEWIRSAEGVNTMRIRISGFSPTCHVLHINLP